MSQPSVKPALTRQFCFNEKALREFLQISRSTIDDSIAQNLNALVTPSKAGFDPSVTRARQTKAAGRTPIDHDSCQKFKNNVLFPSWQARSDVINYCAGVASSPDPDDPDQALRESESARDRQRIVNEAVDPYSARFFPRESRTEMLASLIRYQKGVETIVRERTWALVGERCADFGQNWEKAMEKWQEQARNQK